MRTRAPNRTLDEKKQILEAIDGRPENMTIEDACKGLGIPPRNYHKWKNRMREDAEIRDIRASQTQVTALAHPEPAAAEAALSKRQSYSQAFRKKVVRRYLSRKPGETMHMILDEFGMPRKSQSNVYLWIKQIQEEALTADSAKKPATTALAPRRAVLPAKANGVHKPEALAKIKVDFAELEKAKREIEELKEKNKILTEDNTVLRIMSTLAEARGFMQYRMPSLEKLSKGGPDQ